MKTRLHPPLLTAAGLLLLSAPAFAQAPADVPSHLMGASHPELLPEDTSTAPPPQRSYAPAPVVRAADPGTPPQTSSDHYVPPSDHYVAPSASTTVIAAAPEPHPVSTRALASHPANSPYVITDDVNSGIVTEASIGPNELPAGTSLHGSLDFPLSTRQTLAGAPFSARLVANVQRNGVVLIPVGSIVKGKVTLVHGGKAIGGPAALRLQPRSITLPDGTDYRIEAEVTDLDHAQDSHVNSEGTIVGNTHAKATAVALGLTTGSAVIAGAMIGGGVGAVVGLGVGAGVGTVWWFKRDRQQTLPAGTEIVFTLNNSLLITPATR